VSGRGKHLYFAHPGGVIKNEVRILSGIDIRGDGGFVVAPPSRHAGGKNYSWLGDFHSSLPLFKGLTGEKETTQERPTNQNPEGWIGEALSSMQVGNIDSTLFRICSRLRVDGYTADDAHVLLSPHAERVGATPGHLRDKINNVWKRYEPGIPGKSGLSISRLVSSKQDYTQRQVHMLQQPRVATGYTKLDRLLEGGITPTDLFTVAARTSHGKTNFVLGIARYHAGLGTKILMFTTEMSKSQIEDRFVAAMSSDADFSTHNFMVCDEFKPNLEQIRNAMAEVMPDVFIFDHINHVGEEHAELSQFMKGLQKIARDFNIPGIVLAQLNRNADWIDPRSGQKVIPRLSHIKGSGTIEETSARVLLLAKVASSPDKDDIIGNLDKNRHGEAGIINFGILKNPYRFVEVDE
jgi:hypothetical protein